MTIRHFLTLHDLSTDEIHQVIRSGYSAIKAAHREGRQEPVFAGKSSRV